MRSNKIGIAAILALATLFVSVGASAAPEKEEKGSKEGGGASGGGASGGGLGGGGPSGAGGGTDRPRDQLDTPGQDTTAQEEIPSRDPSKKQWEVGLSAEYHRLFIQNDLEGAAANKNLLVYAAYAEYDPTPKDRIKVRGFVYERFLADPGETGVRADDIILQYTRYQPLPWDMTLKPGAWVTAPTAYTSQKASSITSPRVYVALNKTFGKYVSVEPRTSADYYFVRYGSYDQGATPNTRAGWRAGLNVEAEMPFRRELAIGADIGTAYYLYYQPHATTPGPVVGGCPGNCEPIQQTYGGEIYARYDFSKYRPKKATDLHWDFTLSVANGDPSIGYASAIHDGSLAVYWGYRLNSEVYGVLAARY
jgi:hypothetical protein